MDLRDDERNYLAAATGVNELYDRIRAIVPTMANRANEGDADWETVDELDLIARELGANGAGSYEWARRIIGI